jgi:hypothetical protein
LENSLLFRPSILKQSVSLPIHAYSVSEIDFDFLFSVSRCSVFWCPVQNVTYDTKIMNREKKKENQNGPVSIATSLRAGRPDFDFRKELSLLLFATVDLLPTQPPIQWVPGALSPRAKRPGREADHSLPSSAEVKECVELYPHFPIRLHGIVIS